MRPKLLQSLHAHLVLYGGFQLFVLPLWWRCNALAAMSFQWLRHGLPVFTFFHPRSLETHVHKTAFWTVRNYDDHCTVVVAICGQSQNAPKMVLIIAWACDWFFHCRMPLIAWVRLPPRARPDCREGSRHCLHIFGLGCLMQCCRPNYFYGKLSVGYTVCRFQTWWNQAEPSQEPI